MEDMKEMYEMKEIHETTKIQKRKNKNKGFSLVELIIVIAIMAILVGVVGTQVLPYMEKSREAKDLQVVSAVCTAATTAFAENANELGADATYIYTYGVADHTVVTGDAGAKITTDLKQLLGVASGTSLFKGYFTKTPASDTTATKLDSKAGKTATSVVITYTTATGVVEVQLKNSAGNVLESVSSK
jgi:prepilin-type N-terminal cleavage/methylation domain-containing protein